MSSKYENLPLNPDYLRNLELLARAINPSERLKQINFYQHHNERIKIMSYKNGTTVESMTAMVAALSPGLVLEQAEEYAQQIAAELHEGKHVEDLTLLGAFGWHNIKTAARIWVDGTKELSGQKVIQLYNCLINPQTREHVAIGRNEKRALTQDYTSPDDAFKISKYEYPWIAAHYFMIAARLDVLPCELQAIINFVVTGEMKRNNKVVSA